MAISRYGDADESFGRVRILMDIEGDLTGRDVLLVEDIVDTGLTLSYLLGTLRARGPATIEVCTLLDKSVRRIAPVDVRYAGFDCPDRFVVGYGLDHHERYRNLRDIYAVEDVTALDRDPDALVVPARGGRRRLTRSELPMIAGRVYPRVDAMIEMELAGVRVELPTNQPIVLLKERDGERYLPIWIGAVEAAAIALSLQGVVTPRPMTHDLLKNILEELSVQVSRVVVTELRDSHLLRDDRSAAQRRQLRDLVATLGRDRARRATGDADLRERGGPQRGLDRDPRRRGRGGREVPGVPRRGHAGGLQGVGRGSDGIEAGGRASPSIARPPASVDGSLCLAVEEERDPVPAVADHDAHPDLAEATRRGCCDDARGCP